MSHVTGQIFDLIKVHPEWTMVLIGLTAFGESFLLVSLLFPGTAVLVAAGGLVAAGTLSPLPVIAAGILGGILGDAASFWLGQKFGGALPKLWPFRGNPERIQAGIDFFDRYGAIGVFLGRFLGPLRATVPTAAGMMKMPTGRFYLANTLSAVVWVPALVLSGDLLLRLLGQAEADGTVLVLGAVILAFTIALFWARRRKAVREANDAAPASVAPRNGREKTLD
jgi:membrane protein DedA with SNARE-associated domain